MSSLWTPDGERPVGRAQQDGPTTDSSPEAPIDSGAPLRAAAKELGIDLDSLNDEERAQLQAELSQMMQVRREVAATPASDMLANHLMRLFDLATIYLEGDPPSFGDAATVIEAFRSVVQGVGSRLGEHEHTLNEALSQLQMLFVQVKQAAEASPEQE